MGDRCLLVFTKPPLPGRVKTRLIGHLSATSAASLHQALLADLLDALAGGRFSLRLLYALENGEALPPLSAAAIAGVHRQRGADLGERLRNAFADAVGEHQRVAVIGSDLPGLDAGTVEDAFAELDRGSDVVLGPAADGGYYLLALRSRRFDARLFAAIEWSTGRVLEQTLERCRELGLRAALLAPARDIDTPQDLVWLAEAVRDHRLASPHVAEWVRAHRDELESGSLGRPAEGENAGRPDGPARRSA